MIHIYIRGMSESARDIRRSLDRPTKNIIDHICKLALFPYVQECEHWRKGIYAFLQDIKKQDPKNKFPTSKFIFDSTFGVWGDTISEHMWLVEQNYSEYEPSSVSVSDVEIMCRKYFTWLSGQLSTHGLVPRTVVVDKLHELGL